MTSCQGGPGIGRGEGGGGGCKHQLRPSTWMLEVGPRLTTNSSRCAAVKIGTERKTWMKDSGLKVWGATCRAQNMFPFLDVQIKCLILTLHS